MDPFPSIPWKFGPRQNASPVVATAQTTPPLLIARLAKRTLTATLIVSRAGPSTAEIVAVPGPTARTRPAAETVRTVSSDVTHVTGAPGSDRTTAASCALSPSRIVARRGVMVIARAVGLMGSEQAATTRTVVSKPNRQTRDI